MNIESDAIKIKTSGNPLFTLSKGRVSSKFIKVHLLNSSKTKLITFTGSVAVVRRAVAGPRVAGTKNIGSDDICGGARRLLRIEVADVVKTFIESARSS